MSNLVESYFEPKHLKRFDEYRENNPNHSQYDNPWIYRRLVREGNLDQSYSIPDLDQAWGLKFKPKEKEEKPVELSLLGKVIDAYGNQLPDDEFTQSVFNKSLTGALYEAETGQKKFDLEGVNEGPAEEFMTGLLSLAQPLDIAVLFSGGVIGKSRTNNYLNKLINKGEKNITQKYIKQGTKAFNFRQRARLNFEKNGWALGTYQGTNAYLNAKIEGKGALETAKDVAYHTSLGLILGSASSATGSGILGKRAKLSDKYGPLSYEAVKKMSLSDAALWAGTSAPIRRAAQAGVFTTGLTIDKIIQGENASKDIINDFGKVYGTQWAIESVYNLIGRGRKINTKLGEMFKNKNNDKTEKTVQKTLDNFKEKTKNEKGLEATNDAIKQLSTTRTESSTRFNKLSEDIANIDKAFVKLEKLYKKAPDGKAFEAIAEIKFLESDMQKVLEDIESIVFEPNTIDAANYSKVRQEYDDFMRDYTGFNEKITDDFQNKYLNKAADIERVDELITSFRNLDIPLTVRKGGKDIDILDEQGFLSKGVNLLDLESKLAQYKKDVELKGGKIDDNIITAQVLTKPQFLKQSQAQYESSLLLPDLKPRQIELLKEKHEREKKYADLMDLEPTIPIAPKSNQRIKYNESKKYLDFIIQTKLPSAKYKGAVKLEGGVIERAKHMNSLGSWLATLPTPKSFKTMEAVDVELYVSINPSSRWGVSNLINTLKEAQGQTKTSLIHDSIKTYETGNLPTGKEATQKERFEARGVKIKDYNFEDGIIDKTTYKAGKEGVKKVINTSDKLKNNLNTAKNELEKTKVGLSKPEDYLFADNKGNKLYKEDGNAIINWLGGSKISGKNNVSLWAFRKVLGEYADDLGLTEYKAIDALGLGHRNLTKEEIVAMTKSYGRGKTTLQEVHKDIVDKMYKDISKPKNKLKKYHKLDDPNRYTIAEVGDMLRNIEKMPKTITLETTGNKTANSQIHRTYTKNTIETIFRWALENPSRLTEMFPPTPKNKDIKLEMSSRKLPKTIAKENKDFNKILKNKENAGELDGDKPSVKIEKTQQSIDEINEAKRIREEWKKSKHYDEKNKLNREARAILDRLMKHPKFSERDKNAIIRQSFGTKFYEVSPKYTLDEFKDFKSALQEMEKTIDDPSVIDKLILKTAIPEKIHKELAMEIDKRSGGDANKLSPTGQKIFKNFIETYDPMFSFKDDGLSAHLEDTNKGSYLHRIQTGERFIDRLTGLGHMPFKQGGIGKLGGIYTPKTILTTTHVLLRNIRKFSRGPIKQSTEILEQQVGDYAYKVDMRIGYGNFDRRTIGKYIKSNIGKSAHKDCTWMADELMQNIIKFHNKLDKLDPDLQKLVKKAYEKNIKHYENMNIEGTSEYNARQMLNNSTGGRVWNDFASTALKVNKPAEGTTKHSKIKEKVKNDYIENYFPHIPTSAVLRSGKNSEHFERKLKPLIKKQIEKDAIKKTDAKFPKLKKKKIKDRLDDSNYKKTYLNEKDKILKKEAKDGKIEDKLATRMYNQMTHGEVEVSSPHFMERGEMFDYFIKAPKGSIVSEVKYVYEKAYETGFDNVMNRYYISSAKHISRLEHFPEYMSKEIYYSKDNGPVMNSLTKIRRYEQKHPTGKKGKDELTYYYLKDLIENRLIEVNGPGGASSAVRFFGNFTSAAGLSAIFEPGFKNFGLGAIQTISSRPARFYMKAIMQRTNKESWESSRERAIKLGATGFVEREFGLAKGKNKDWWDKLDVTKAAYTWSAMRAFEDLNRTLDIEAARYWVTFCMQELKDGLLTNKQEGAIRDWLGDSARLTPDDMKLIDSGKIFEDSNEGIAAHNHIMDKASVYAHKATQGGVGPLDAPMWMSEPRFKYFLTFLRTARSVTTNLHQSVLKPWIKYGNTGPLLKLAAGSLGFGYVQGLMKSVLYSDEEPTSTGSIYDKIFYALNRMEIAGSWGMMLDRLPGYGRYTKSKNVEDNLRELWPAMVDMLMDLTTQVGNLAYGTKTFKQAGHRFLSDNIRIYGQIDKFRKKGLLAQKIRGVRSKDYDLIKDAFELKRQYKVVRDKGYSPQNESPTVNTSNYDLIKNALYFGSEEDIAKAYWTAHTELMAADEADSAKNWEGANYSPKKMFDDAHSRINQSISSMNPIPLKETTKGQEISDRDAYLKWLLENGGQKAVDKALKAESVYQRTYRALIKKIRRDKDWQKEYGTNFNLTYDK